MATVAYTVGDSAVQVFDPDDYSEPVDVTINNTTGTTVYSNDSSGVTTANGFPHGQNQPYTYYKPQTEIWLISIAGTFDVRVNIQPRPAN